tara:strand:+ start:77 stop:352 length:276 start_codon:yes stop_codon:yes gene_type:complete
MDLVKRVKELEGRLIEVMSAGAVRFKELEEALSHANGKLNSIQDFCETEQDAWKENEEELRDNPNASTDYELLQGRAEFAEQILDYLEEEE